VVPVAAAATAAGLVLTLAFTATAATSFSDAIGAGSSAGESATTVAPTTDAGPDTTLAPLPEPDSESSDPARLLTPNVAALPEALTSDVDQQEAILTALAAATDTVATVRGPGTLCATVAVTEALMAGGRWERDGEPFETSSAQRRDPPGYGECIVGDNGEAFEEGVYQYLAVGPTGAISAVATLVVGVERVSARFLNNSTVPVCLVLLSPEPADYYESRAPNAPLPPGEAIGVPMADIAYDVRVYGCPPDEELASFRLRPEADRYIEMFDADDRPSSDEGPTPTSTATTPTTATT